MTFSDLGLIAPILKALQEEGYTQPTPIQAQAIPVLLQGRDLLGCAQTGTGKTAAFAIPILQLMTNRPATKRGAIRALILTPTRELALQIDESFGAYGRHLPLRHTVIFGGVSQHAQTERLKRGVDILTATPGRLLDLMQQGFIHLNDIEFFVLDEADRMLDMGFIHDVRKVLAKLPARRHSLFFSATMPPDVSTLAQSILTQPARVEVTPVSSTAEKVEQCVYMVEKKEKRDLLIHLLKVPGIRNALVFTRTKHGANKVAKDLNAAGIFAEAIHGNKSQNARQQALANFKSGKSRVLVATDIAARGIDIDELSHVVNYELPNVPETYVHRIGRTGRAGASGMAISFCEEEERTWLRDIVRLIGMQIPVVQGHPYESHVPMNAPLIPPPPLGRQQQQRSPRSEGRPRQEQPRREHHQKREQPRHESRPRQEQQPRKDGPKALPHLPKQQPQNRPQQQQQPKQQPQNRPPQQQQQPKQQPQNRPPQQQQQPRQQPQQQQPKQQPKPRKEDDVDQLWPEMLD